MRKIENLNIMKNTVLRLEKEINAISNNLSKVKNKDHTTMKKIIHNINYLLTKENNPNNFYPNDRNYLNPPEENKTIEKNQEVSNNKYIHTKDNNIDYILIPLNQLKNKSKPELKPDEPYFNKKNKVRQNRHISEGKSHNYNKYLYDMNNNTNLIINENIKNPSQNTNNSIKYNRIIDFRNNQIIQKNRIAYSKPRLQSECIKKHSKNKICLPNSINNNLNINNNNISIENERKESGAMNLKFYTLNNKVNNKNNFEDRAKKTETIKNLYYNYQNSNENNFYKKEFSNENKKDKNYIYKNNFSEKDLNKIEREYIEKKNEKINKKESENIFLSPKKNKKLIFERKQKRNKTSNIDSNPKMRNSFNVNRWNKCNKNMENLQEKTIITNNYMQINKKYSITHKNNIDDLNLSDKENYNTNYNYIHPYYENQNPNQLIKDLQIKNNKQNNKYLNNNSCQSTIKKLDYIFDEKYSNKNIYKDKDNNIDIDKMNKLLNALNVDNINDAIFKVEKLLKYDQYIYKMKEFYLENNDDDDSDKMNLDNNLMWLSNIVKKYKKNEAYKNYCKSIMMQNKIKNFDGFKHYINNILAKNRKNKGFLVEVKNILCEEDYYSKNNNKIIKKINIRNKMNKINNINYEQNNKLKKKIHKNTSDNSNDIRFNQNDDNCKIVNEHMSTYY